jgi:predicted ester cyclase
MSVTENKELVHRYFDERWNKKNYAVIDELLAPNWDVDEQKTMVAGMHAAVGDLQLTMDQLIAEDDRVVVPWELTGIHQGEFMGVEPTGKQVTFRGLAILRIADGKIVEDEAFGDMLEVLLDKS